MAAPLALALDAALGWPGWLHARTGHPVGAFAWLISTCEQRWNRPNGGAMAQRLAGVATVALLLVLSAGGGWLIECTIRSVTGPWAWLLVALAAWPGLAARSLYDHVRPVFDALMSGDLPRARAAVARIVGRDTDALDPDGVARAAIESLAESFCDGVVAPLFWFMIGGLPGIWAYKALNTADSLIGHPEPPLRAFGWAAARGDDLANLIPARLAGLVLCLAGGGGWRVLWRDHAAHASPNAGWPEAAMAGALGVRLAGPVRYEGAMCDKPWIGDGVSADGAALGRALAIYRRACVLLWLVAAAPAIGVLAGGMTWLG